jgi:hypothetical protein
MYRYNIAQTKAWRE